MHLGPNFFNDSVAWSGRHLRQHTQSAVNDSATCAMTDTPLAQSCFWSVLPPRSRVETGR